SAPPPTAEPSQLRSEKQLMRSSTNKKVAGVCGGLAAYFGVSSTLVRVISFFVFLFTGVGIFLYPVLWIALPLAPTPQSGAVPQSEAGSPAGARSGSSVIVQAAKQNK